MPAALSANESPKPISKMMIKNRLILLASIKLQKMKNTKLLLLGVLPLLALSLYQCKCPKCPPSNIVTDNADTLSLSIVTDNADTLSLQVVAPTVVKDGKVEKSSIVIDNADMTRIIRHKMNEEHFDLKVRPRRDTTANSTH